VDKGKEVVRGVIDSAGKFINKVNPLNNLGFYAILGLRGVYFSGIYEQPFRSCSFRFKICPDDGLVKLT